MKQKIPRKGVASSYMLSIVEFIQTLHDLELTSGRVWMNSRLCYQQKQDALQSMSISISNLLSCHAWWIFSFAANIPHLLFNQDLDFLLYRSSFYIDEGNKYAWNDVKLVKYLIKVNECIQRQI